MERIATATADANKFGGGKNGFKDGDLAGGIAPTQLEAEWFDQMQEELAAIIEGYGVALDAADKHQASGALLKATAQIQPITASVGANALTVTLNPTILDFRAADLTSGAVTKVLVPAAISLVVSSGSTLGTVSAVKNRLAILAILYNGAVELAIANIKGGVNLDETTLISTTAEGGAGAADSATLIYSATARTNVPFRVVGYKESTQATAGTWATAPSKIQGAGGLAMSALTGFGAGQVWTDVTGSRAFGATYYNTTGKAIALIIRGTTATTGATISINVGGFSTYGEGQTSASLGIIHQITVPPQASYSAALTGGSLAEWFELR